MADCNKYDLKKGYSCTEETNHKLVNPYDEYTPICRFTFVSVLLPHIVLTGRGRLPDQPSQKFGFKRSCVLVPGRGVLGYPDYALRRNRTAAVK